MMNLSQKLFAICSCIALFSACKKDKPKPNNYISFKADGVYSNLSPKASYSADNGTVLMDAGDSKKNKISLSFSVDAVIGSYDLGTYQEENAICDYYNDSGVHFSSDSGTFMIGNALSDGSISGTFDFIGHTLNGSPNTVRITEGQFSTNVSNLSFSTDTDDSEDYEATGGRSKVINHYLSRKRLIFNNIKVHPTTESKR